MTLVAVAWSALTLLLLEPVYDLESALADSNIKHATPVFDEGYMYLRSRDWWLVRW